MTSSTVTSSTVRPCGRVRRGRIGSAAAVLFGALAVHTGVSGGTSTETDVMAWLDQVDPAITIDQSNECMVGATDPVAYRNDRIVLRSGLTNSGAATLVNARLNAVYGTAAVSYVDSIERITFPNTPPANMPVTPVLSVTLNPRPGGAAHEVVRASRAIREQDRFPASPDYALMPSGPYNFFWPNGYPQKIDELTPPRADLTPGGLPIGSGVKIEVVDTGLAPVTAGELPTTSTLSKADEEWIDAVANGAKMADYPHVGHGKAIAGIIHTIAPGAEIQQVRVSGRDGLATDVSAARGTARSLRVQTRQDYPDVLVNAFGTAVCDRYLGVAGPALEPIGLQTVTEVVDRFDPYQPDGMLIVASAGNMATTRPHYPAAFDTVLGIGSLDGNADSDQSPWSAPARTAPVSAFSNRGPWVDGWAPGEALPTNHVDGVRFEYGGDILDGRALVDGTSFAGPLVAGLIAEKISTSAADARSSWAAIAAAGAPPLPQCGTGEVVHGVAVALASLTEPADGQAIGPAEPCDEPGLEAQPASTIVQSGLPSAA